MFYESHNLSYESCRLLGAKSHCRGLQNMNNANDNLVLENWHQKSFLRGYRGLHSCTNSTINFCRHECIRCFAKYSRSSRLWVAW